MSGTLLRLSIFLLLPCQIFWHAQLYGQGAATSTSTAKSSAAEGQRIFSTTCAACHGLDARGGERGPDIVNRKEVQLLTDDALFHIVQDGKAGTGMPAFRSLGTEQIQAVARYLRSLQGRTAEEQLPGDAERGKGFFIGKAGCSKCHMANGEGGFIGPELSSYARNRPVEDVRSAITDPDNNLDPRQRPITVTLSDGKKQTGMIRNEDNFSLQIQAFDGSFHFFTKSELRNVEFQARSLMPSDYESRLSAQELDDIISYLISIGRSNGLRNSTKPLRNEE
jgi:cytochrome c oxidase cbb3-type subunit III